MTQDQPWLILAKQLPCGHHMKIHCTHCTGSSKSLMVSHSEKGYSCHCFRCFEPEAHQFIRHGNRSLMEIMAHKKQLEEVKSKPPFMPTDSMDVDKDQAWFLKYGISMTLAEKYGFKFSEFYNRVCIPVYSANGTLTAVQGRALTEQHKPKWLYMGKPEKDSVFYANKEPLIGPLVVTEDILSAIKVARIGVPCISMLGSHISDGQLQKIMAHAKHVRVNDICIWLDGDDAGKAGASYAMKQFQLQGIEPKIVKSKLDPKEYGLEEIERYIKNA